MPSIGANNKRKGSNAERFYAKIFRDLGFDKCITSRQGSRLHDNAGIDLMFLPYNIQIKCGKQKGINYSKELQYIRDRIKELFPEGSPEFVKPNILIHKKPKIEGKRDRGEFDELVVMSMNDFITYFIKE